MFLHAAAMLGVNPEECVVFEDSKIGFEAAQKAGMLCIAIKNNHNKDLLHQVAHAIEHYHDAHQALKDLFHIADVEEKPLASLASQEILITK
jgi:beta-phosphoglucomutase-like phosphatase (HAD superfamily)